MKKSVILIILLVIVISLVSAKRVHEISSEKIGIPNVRINVDDSEHYVYGLKLEAIFKDGEIKFVHSDDLGSNRVITDSSGNKIEEIKYLPFGKPLQEFPERFGFTNKEKDESELMYYGARYYDADIGRFTQPDPAKQGVNKYIYANNNPLIFFDPDGKRNRIKHWLDMRDGYWVDITYQGGLTQETEITISTEVISKVRNEIEVDRLPGETMCAFAISRIFSEHYVFDVHFNRLSNREKIKNLGVLGDAWDYPRNILDLGGTIAFSGGFEEYSDLSEEQVSSIREGDILGVRYYRSGYEKTAKKELGEEGYFTHVALVVGSTEEDVPILLHFYNTDMIIEPLDSLLEGKEFKLINVMRPDYPD